MQVLLAAGAAYVLFDDRPSSDTCQMLERAGFRSRLGTIWAGTPDDLLRTTLPRECMPPGCAATWPRDWSSGT